MNVHYSKFHFLPGDLPPGVLHLHGQYGLTILKVFSMTVILTLSSTIIFRLLFVSILSARSFVSFLFQIKVENIPQYPPEKKNSAWEVISKDYSYPKISLFLLSYSIASLAGYRTLVWGSFPSEFRSIVHFLLPYMVVLRFFIQFRFLIIFK